MSKHFEQAGPEKTDRALTPEEIMKESEELAGNMKKLMKLVEEGKVSHELKYDEKTGNTLGRIMKDVKTGEIVFWEDERLIDLLIKKLDESAQREN